MSLLDDLTALAGPRFTDADLARAVAFAEHRLAAWAPRRQPYTWEGRDLVNLIAECPGPSGGWILCAAHLDTLAHSPGANDNASGVAALFALADHFATAPLGHHGLRLVVTTNEEVMAVDARAGGTTHLDLTGVQAFLALDTLAAHDPRWGTQGCPRWWLRPWFGWRGDFLAVVGPWSQRPFQRRLAAAMAGDLPIRAIPAPAPWTLYGDHAPAAAQGIPAVRVTDTDRWRDRHYHRASDTLDKIDPAHLARVVAAITRGVAHLLAP